MNDRKHIVLVAIQQALLGEVSARLRCVSLSWEDTSVHFDCYFDGEIDDRDRDSMSYVETELMAAFPATHAITHAVHRLDYPAPLPQDHIRAFSRRETL